jgi:hypothetical protein
VGSSERKAKGSFGQKVYSGFSSHLILKEEFPAILWQNLQHAVFVCGGCHYKIGRRFIF